MDFETVMSIIGDKAFPIACCIILFWSTYKERENHKAEMQQITTALNNNTNALIELKDIVRFSNGNKD